MGMVHEQKENNSRVPLWCKICPVSLQKVQKVSK